MFDEERDEPYEGVEGVETLGAHQRRAVCLLRQCSVAQVYAHLGAQAEEPGDQIVCLQDALLVHLKRQQRMCREYRPNCRIMDPHKNGGAHDQRI